MITGSCLCGGIRFQISGSLFGAINCHCSLCRKAHGAACRSRALVRATDFKLIAGENYLKFFESSPDSHRGFCGNCGSPIYGRFGENPKYFNIALGIIDGDPGVKIEQHAFVGSKGSWYEIEDDLPQHDRRLPEGNPARMPNDNLRTKDS